MDTNRIFRIGNVSTGSSQGGMCYGTEGIFPAITAGTHGYGMGNIVIVDDLYANREPRIYEDYAPTLRSERSGLKVGRILGAAMRGRYNEDGKIEQQIELNGTEISNAITTVQKDSLVVMEIEEE